MCVWVEYRIRAIPRYQREGIKYQEIKYSILPQIWEPASTRLFLLRTGGYPLFHVLVIGIVIAAPCIGLRVFLQNVHNTTLLFQKSEHRGLFPLWLLEDRIIDELNTTIQRLHSDIDLDHFHNLDTRRRLAELKVSRSTRRRGGRATPKRDQRRALSTTTCSEPSGPQLVVDGVCSCTDVLVGNRSTATELSTMNTTLYRLYASLLDAVDTVAITVSRIDEDLTNNMDAMNVMNATVTDMDEALFGALDVVAGIGDNVSDIQSELIANTYTTGRVFAGTATCEDGYYSGYIRDVALCIPCNVGCTTCSNGNAYGSCSNGFDFNFGNGRCYCPDENVRGYLNGVEYCVIWIFPKPIPPCPKLPCPKLPRPMVARSEIIHHLNGTFEQQTQYVHLLVLKGPPKIGWTICRGANRSLSVFLFIKLCDVSKSHVWPKHYEIPLRARFFLYIILSHTSVRTI